MEMIKVSSSDLRSVGYDELTQTLVIVFHNGSYAYQYPNVPKEIYEGLMNASSKGRYFHRAIKNKFSFNKIPKPI